MNKHNIPAAPVNPVTTPNGRAPTEQEIAKGPGPRPQTKHRFWDREFAASWAEDMGGHALPEDRILFGRVPQELRDRPQWVVWRYTPTKDESAWTKVPYQSRRPSRKASSTDPETWSTFAEAEAAFLGLRKGTEADRLDGIGFVFSADDPFVGIDLDHSLTSVRGGAKPWAFEYLERLNSYTEVSPSGHGVKVLIRGTPPETRGRKKNGLDTEGGAVEIYSRERFFTITGDRLDRWAKTIEDRTPELAALHAELFPPEPEKPARRPVAPAPPLASDDDLIAKARAAKNGAEFSALFDQGQIPAGRSHSEADLKLCGALGFWFGGDVDAIDRVFRRSALYRDKWDRADYRERTISRALDGMTEFYDPGRRRNGIGGHPSANGDGRHHETGNGQTGTVEDVDGRATVAEPVVLENDNDPHRLANVVLGTYTDDKGISSLVHFQEQYERHEGTCFRSDPFFAKGELVCKIKADLDRCNIKALATWDGEGRPPTVVRVTRSLVGDVNHALASIASVDRPEEPPFWIDPGPDDPDPVSLLPARNGLVDLSATPPVVLPHTPLFFSRFVLPYAYDPGAPQPTNWIKLLKAQWPEDPETIDSIHEILGYLLTPDTSQHRIFLWIGPPRSGRSTMREVFTGLIGPRNVGSTSAIALGSPFGLEPLLGKSVAIMGDARTGDSHDTAVLLDRLLRISGCDPVEVNRKGRAILPDVQMRTRFLIISNELPNFRDASGAIVSRYHVIQATRTIPPEERIPDLAKTIIASELPGILNLAIEGRRRLYERGRFIQPAAAAELIEDAADMASPVKRFVRECYAFDPDAVEPATGVFARWKSWAIEHGFPLSNDAVLGKNLRAAYPSIKTVRPRVDGRQVTSYQGIRQRIAF